MPRFPWKTPKADGRPRRSYWQVIMSLASTLCCCEIVCWQKNVHVSDLREPTLGAGERHSHVCRRSSFVLWHVVCILSCSRIRKHLQSFGSVWKVCGSMSEAPWKRAEARSNSSEARFRVVLACSVWHVLNPEMSDRVSLL